MPIQTFARNSTDDFYPKAKAWYAPLLGTVIVDDGVQFVADFLPVPGMKIVIRNYEESPLDGWTDAVYLCTDWNSSSNKPINKIPVLRKSTPYNGNYMFKNNEGSIYGLLYNDISGLGFNMLFKVGNDWYLLTAANDPAPYHKLVKAKYPYEETYNLIGLAVDNDYVSSSGRYYMAPVYLAKDNQIISAIPNIYCITRKAMQSLHMVTNNYLLITPYKYGFEGLKSWLLIDLLY